jgi:hypothetical protein
MSDRITIRLDPKLKAAAEKMAGSTPLGTWARSLIEEKTGVVVPMPQGFAALSKKEQAKIAAKGGKARGNNFEKK